MNKSGDNREEMSMPASGTDTVDYFDYLRQRSVLALLYRKHWLYPRLCRHLSGAVLDVGCGIGDLLAFRADTTGTDINPRAVAWCRDKGYPAELMMPDVLPFQNSVFDGVVIDNVLEHIADPVPLLDEVRRVLRPGGRALIGVPGRRGYACDPDHKVYYDEAGLVAV
ncbi:MAG TPA: methyltransferase domain-containing protein, partial [Rhodocyclaceae bacterium]|nr:methyltransferase domain-containing protein [Rhodocyclaceae bacterium]